MFWVCVCEVQGTGGMEMERRKGRGYGDHEWVARKPQKVLEELPGIEEDHLAAAC